MNKQKKTALRIGARVWAKLLTTGLRPNGRVLHRETLELLKTKLGEDYLLVDQENGEVALCGTVEVGKVADAGDLIIRSQGVSLGPSSGRHHFTSWGTTGPITCEWCGRDWNEDADPDNGGDTSVSVGEFNGSQVVEECCGKLFDVLFDEFGERFFEEYLRQLVEGSTLDEFAVRQLMGAARKIRERASGIVKQADEALGEKKEG